jgi:hypothetical protein
VKTAVLVVNAERNTAPLGLASGYASEIQADSGGAPALIKNPMRIRTRPNESGCIASNATDPVSAICDTIPIIRITPPRRWTSR